MYEILKKEQLAPQLYRYVVKAPRVAAKAKPGQFLILRVTSDGERVPLTIARSFPEDQAVEIIVQSVGRATRMLAELNVGESLSDVVGPLGNPTHFGDVKRVLCVGGGVGTAVLFPQVDALSKMDVEVTLVQGARSKDYVVMEADFRARADRYLIATDDGSYGHKGFVTDVVKDLLEKETFDLCIAIGPPMMMKAVCDVTRPYNLRTIVSLNPIMIDGTGMCGGCRVMVGGQVKYACVDGPEFDGHATDFDNLMRRLKAFKGEEAHQCNLYEEAKKVNG